eukprot:CAMPEP_0118680914 /NCGR_PEP_ID=MMETSP0800-20121206/4642_1 /TAXON_ID=210618 ORGANISM="Striatella unipunctata, Strain CCMP2910" /NCGR_SAMPLE_ID=MMETSP0800 /ASSEMBLY_ACC=CAM_ASM_000638 /LENGTH=155 /DNA_ID=CAMNT_0006577141 /DNA_START=53 /DNA_END=520 /DNA_ORIENTATION=-
MTTSDSNKNAKWLAIMAGGLTFLSLVDSPSIKGHIRDGNTQLILDHFPIWWPHGRNMMVPLIGVGALANALAYKATSHRSWAWSGFLIFLLAPYTKLLMGEDIETLRNADLSQVANTAIRFCNFHHGRSVMALASFGLSLVGLADLNQNRGEKKL